MRTDAARAKGAVDSALKVQSVGRAHHNHSDEKVDDLAPPRRPAPRPDQLPETDPEEQPTVERGRCFDVVQRRLRFVRSRLEERRFRRRVRAEANERLAQRNLGTSVRAIHSKRARAHCEGAPCGTIRRGARGPLWSIARVPPRRVQQITRRRLEGRRRISRETAATNARRRGGGLT